MIDKGAEDQLEHLFHFQKTYLNKTLANHTMTWYLFMLLNKLTLFSNTLELH